MQYFTFTLHESGTNGDSYIVRIPVSTHTLSVEGDLSLDEVCDYFQQFVVGCGYHLKPGSHIGVIDEE